MGKGKQLSAGVKSLLLVFLESTKLNSCNTKLLALIVTIVSIIIIFIISFNYVQYYIYHLYQVNRDIYYVYAVNKYHIREKKKLLKRTSVLSGIV